MARHLAVMLAPVLLVVWLLAPAFVAPQPQTLVKNTYRLGAGGANKAGTNVGEEKSSASAVVGLAVLATVVAASSASVRSSGRTSLRAEPISAAAAAAAAGKAAAAKAAASAGAKAAAGTVGAGAGASEAGEEKGDKPLKPGFDPARQLGVTDPLGYFDPAGFCKMDDEAGFRNLRVAEIKHGRVAMMAALGAVVQHYVQFPGFADVPKGLGAVVTTPGSYGFGALFVLSGALELALWTESDNKEPGNFGDPLGLNQYNEDMRNRELNNGRAAMFAALGIISAELYTGKDAIEQFGL